MEAWDPCDSCPLRGGEKMSFCIKHADHHMHPGPSTPRSSTTSSFMPSSSSSGRSKHNFNETWLQQETLKSWLEWDRSSLQAYCRICRFHGKSNIFSKGFSGNKKGFQLSQFKEHLSSAQHQAAVETSKEQSTIKNQLTKIQKKQIEAYENVSDTPDQVRRGQLLMMQV